MQKEYVIVLGKLKKKGWRKQKISQRESHNELKGNCYYRNKRKEESDCLLLKT